VYSRNRGYVPVLKYTMSIRIVTPRLRSKMDRMLRRLQYTGTSWDDTMFVPFGGHRQVKCMSWTTNIF